MTPGGTCESALMPRSTFFHMLNQSVNDDHVFRPLYFGPTLILQSLNEGVMLLISETFPSFSAARCVPLSLSIGSYLRAQLTLACWGKARPPPPPPPIKPRFGMLDALTWRYDSEICAS